LQLSREEILAVYEQGPEAVVQFVQAIVETLSGRIDELTERVAELEARLNMNSRNSSKPPSSDGLSRPSAPRGETSRPPGGKRGHKGGTLMTVEDPDWIVTHAPHSCLACGRSLDGVKPSGNDARQVFDVPITSLEVTEHQRQTKRCPSCGCENRGEFPEGVGSRTQYGPNLRAFLSYLTVYQLIPLKRACELVSDLFGHEVCEATLLNTNGALSQALAPVEEAIRRGLIDSEVGCFDETGVRIDGKTSWLHVACSPRLTYYAVHTARGRRAMDDIGILPEFKGTAVHDALASYFGYSCGHALCNAHLLRELKCLAEEGQSWASDMKDLLRDTLERVNRARERGEPALPRRALARIEKRYSQIVVRGLAQNPMPGAEGQPARRGRKKRSKAQNLLERLRNHHDKVLAFARDFSVSFDNNLAERDLRMAKVKMKISGTFRSWDGAHDFCRIRGYISTARKNSVSVIGALSDAFEGEPYLPHFLC